MPAPLKGAFYALGRRGQRGVLTAALLVHALFALAIVVAFPLANYEAFEWAILGVDVPEADTLILRAMASGVVLVLAYMIVMASFEAACLRWMLRGETGRSGGFSLGGDTWRVFGGNLIWFVVASVATLVASALSGLAISMPNLGAEDSLLFIAVGLGSLTLALLLLLMPVGVRMGAGNAASVSRRRFAYFDSWRVTDRRVRALTGSYLTLWALWLVVFAPTLVGVRAILFQTMGVMGIPDMLTETGQILMISTLTLLYLLSNLAIVFFLSGVNARAVQAAVEDGKIEGVSANVAQVFD